MGGVDSCRHTCSNGEIVNEEVPGAGAVFAFVRNSQMLQQMQSKERPSAGTRIEEHLLSVSCHTQVEPHSNQKSWGKHNTMPSIPSLSPFSTGDFGCKIQLPAGARVVSDDGDRLELVDNEESLSWSIRFFEDLHMDLREGSREHLEKGIQRQTIAAFEEQFWKSFPSNTTRMTPITQDDPNWSPVIDIEYKEVDTISKHSTTALVVTYRKAYRPGEQIVVGRLCIPVLRGLIEIVVEAEDKGHSWREATVVADLCRDKVMTTEALQEALKSHEFDAQCYDERFPSHCLSRVRRSLSWLIDDYGLTVSEPPEKIEYPPNGETSLPRLACKFRPPQRFVSCSNSSNPESNKQRFYRATLGGEGVQMLVLSAWHTHSYAPTLQKPGKGTLRQIAHHAALSIHRSQGYRRIDVSVEDAPATHRARWRGCSGAGATDSVITVVDCEESDGTKRQNTIGWIRDSSANRTYLIYFADTLNADKKEVQTELLDSLFSISSLEGVPYASRKSSRSLWNISSALVR